MDNISLNDQAVIEFIRSNYSREKPGYLVLSVACPDRFLPAGWTYGRCKLCDRQVMISQDAQWIIDYFADEGLLIGVCSPCSIVYGNT